MVVQTKLKKIRTVNFVEIPKNIPKEIIENDSMLAIEKSVNKLETRVIITADAVIGMNRELKTQIFEIDRLENAIISMNEFIASQHNRISLLENQIREMKITNNDSTSMVELNGAHDKNRHEQGFWARLFSK